jgi:2-isopropylmalate synthase
MVVMATEEKRAATSALFNSLSVWYFCQSARGDAMSDEQAGSPIELSDALSENKAAERIFAALPPSHRNEYLRWISEAKRAETRRRRAIKAAEMMVDKHGRPGPG